MKKFCWSLILVVVGCASHTGTLKANRNTFLEYRSRLLDGSLRTVKYQKQSQNDDAQKTLIELTEAAITNIDAALGEKTLLSSVAPVTSGE